MCENSITITGETMLEFIKNNCRYQDSYWDYFNHHIYKCMKQGEDAINKMPVCFPCMSCKEHLRPNIKKDIKEKDKADKNEIKMCEINNAPCNHCKPTCNDWIYKENK